MLFQIPISSIRIYCMEDNCGSLITRSIHKDLRNGMRNLVSQLSNKHGLVVKQVSTLLHPINSSLLLLPVNVDCDSDLSGINVMRFGCLYFF